MCISPNIRNSLFLIILIPFISFNNFYVSSYFIFSLFKALLLVEASFFIYNIYSTYLNSISNSIMSEIEYFMVVFNYILFSFTAKLYELYRTV